MPTTPRAGAAATAADEDEWVSGRGGYHESPQHAKTLELLRAVRKAPPLPSDAQLRRELKAVVLEHEDELASLNPKSVRQLVEQRLQCDLREKRKWVRESLREIVQEHFDAGEAEATEQATAPAVPESTATAGLGRGLSLIMPDKRPKGPSLLVQLDRANALDGGTGAVGRLTVRDDKLTIDLKGRQHHTVVRPCASFLVVSVHDDTQTAKIETVVNEFCELGDGHDMLAQMSGVVVRGELDQDEFDGDIDVNVSSARGSKRSRAAAEDEEEPEDSDQDGTTASKGSKRGSGGKKQPGGGSKGKKAGGKAPATKAKRSKR